MIHNGGEKGAVVKRIVEEKTIVIREITPVEIILYSVFLYLSGLSFRKVSSTIKPFIKRSRTFVWEWVHKFGDMLRDCYSDRLLEVVVIDEASLKVGHQIIEISLHYNQIISHDERDRHMELYRHRRYSACMGCMAMLREFYRDG